MIKVVVFVAFFAIPALGEELACRDEDGNQVEWYIAYKIPRNGNDGQSLKSGSNYSFLLGPEIKKNDNPPKPSVSLGYFGAAPPAAAPTALKNDFWRASVQPIESSRSMVARTLSPIYAYPGDFSFVMYNDEPGRNGRRNMNLGFSKGVLAANKDQGFWMVHSLPQFPPRADQCYDYPRNNGEGDMFFCMSIKADKLDKVVTQLKTIQPNVYDSYLREDIVTKVTEITSLNGQNMYNQGGGGMYGAGYGVANPEGKEEIELSKGKKITSYSRFTNRDQTGDFYQSLERSLQKNIFVKTRDSSLGSSCSGYVQTLNIKRVGMSFNPQAVPLYAYSTGPWNNNYDRSRWVVTAQENEVCITDLDRRRDHSKRGGLALCIDDKEVWKTFSDSTVQLEQCRNG